MQCDMMQPVRHHGNKTTCLASSWNRKNNVMFYMTDLQYENEAGETRTQETDIRAHQKQTLESVLGYVCSIVKTKLYICVYILLKYLELQTPRKGFTQLISLSPIIQIFVKIFFTIKNLHLSRCSKTSFFKLFFNSCWLSLKNLVKVCTDQLK